MRLTTEELAMPVGEFLAHLAGADAVVDVGRQEDRIAERLERGQAADPTDGTPVCAAAGALLARWKRWSGGWSVLWVRPENLASRDPAELVHMVGGLVDREDAEEWILNYGGPQQLYQVVELGVPYGVDGSGPLTRLTRPFADALHYRGTESGENGPTLATLKLIDKLAEDTEDERA
jgi:hypothetical protein